jgi:hypothetical protein
LSHDAVVGTCLAGLPFALVPLWHVEHVPAATPLWLKVAGSHAVVLWQESHDAVVGTWFAGLPLAPVPLWQLPQVPVATLAWLNLAGVQAPVW